MSRKGQKASRPYVTRSVRNVTGGAIPVTDELFTQMVELMSKIPPEATWTAKMVADEMVMTVKLLQRVGGSVGPRFKPTNWPQALREWGDFLAMVETDEIAKERADHRITPTPRQITRMEQAMRWQATYLAAHDGPRRVMRLWLRCKAHRRPFSDACQQVGWSRATAYRARDRALFLIAIGLMKDGVLP